jgi:hypothetical protein
VGHAETGDATALSDGRPIRDTLYYKFQSVFLSELSVRQQGANFAVDHLGK